MPSRTPFLLASACVALVACRKEEVGPIELSAPPSGALVRPTEVRARLSTIVGLGSAPTELTSSAAREGRNTVGAFFTVQVDQAVPPGLQMAGESTCWVGERTIAQPLTWTGTVANTPSGESREFHTQYMPTIGAEGEPSACEFSLFHGSPGLRDGPKIEPVLLATVCWTKSELVEGACPADILPRNAGEGEPPLAIPVLQGAVQASPRNDGYGVVAAYLVTANAPVPARARIVGNLRCRVDGEIVTASAGTLTMIDHLSAGESIGGHAQSFANPPLATAPEWCTIELESRVGEPTERRTPIASFCIRDDRAEPGACE